MPGPVGQTKASFDIRVTELRKEQNRARLARMREARKVINKRLRPAIRRAAQPAVDSVREAVMAVPVKRETGLRAGIARGTRVRTSLRAGSIGVSVRTTGARLPPKKRELAKLLNDPAGFRHPLFGDKNHWYHQEGHPYFEPAIDRVKTRVRHDVEEAIKKALDEAAS